MTAHMIEEMLFRSCLHMSELLTGTLPKIDS